MISWRPCGRWLLDDGFLFITINSLGRVVAQCQCATIIAATENEPWKNIALCTTSCWRKEEFPTTIWIWDWVCEYECVMDVCGDTGHKTHMNEMVEWGLLGCLLLQTTPPALCTTLITGGTATTTLMDGGKVIAYILGLVGGSAHAAVSAVLSGTFTLQPAVAHVMSPPRSLRLQLHQRQSASTWQSSTSRSCD
jgi:hypothetical protein